MAPDVSPVAAWESLFRAQVTVMRQLATEFPTDIVSLNEYDVMFNLFIQPKKVLRIRDLGEKVLLTQPSISRLVDRLVARGILEKNDDPTDGRGTLVGLTEHGVTMYRQAAVQHAQSISTHMSGHLSPEELDELARLCDKLRTGVAGK
ncbi:MarR family winged helix-turn-helix transcriptional regulator [Herbiconiux sp. KACC 21604]|uniref:MarR family winged helix-turn-helix transcriptional regulator n=1 Tax=unclassified Herbiconiux TaxID=2618217 RepID=UPI0020A23BC5|nr:MarR family winged helix-turn-helix transcriptional regulator [Herbiconiux sp. SALV-R1]WPO87041.1 MarR family winged helix-turn-helix transcriptional regulator [Herbiconiux sp. KACC 21604]